ncbi:MAG: CapA family protein [Clostridia bacterium]|nr:CapA family protein [Clostridia bacterium]
MKKFYIYLFCTITCLLLIFSSCNKSGQEEMAEPFTNENEAGLLGADKEQDLNSNTEQTPQQEPEIIEYRTSFIGCGDNIIYGTKDARSKAIPGGRELNYKPHYAPVAHIIENADIAFINQETVMCGEGYQLSFYPLFNSPQDVGYDLVELGFDVVNIATNHMLDKGAKGLLKTIEFWKSLDTLMIGGYENKEDFDNIRVLEKDGLKIAFLAYTYGTNGLTKDPYSNVIIPYINDEDIIRQTALAKQKADLVFVSVHWGVEGAFTPNSEQIRVAQLFADNGVDVILGHHPHVIQPVEWLEGKDGNKTLCVYSLGNFMAEQDYDYNMVGGIITFDIVHSTAFKPYIDNVIFVPTVFHFTSNFMTNEVYRMEDYTPQLASVHGVKLYYGHKLTYDGLLKYATDTIDEQFLPDFFKSDDQQSEQQ